MRNDRSQHKGNAQLLGPRRLGRCAVNIMPLVDHGEFIVLGPQIAFAGNQQERQGRCIQSI